MLRDKLNEALKDAMRARDMGSVGTIRLILANGMVYLKSPLLAGMYHKPWVQGPASAMGGMSGVSLGPLLGLLQTSSPAVQLPLLIRTRRPPVPTWSRSTITCWTRSTRRPRIRPSTASTC